MASLSGVRRRELRLGGGDGVEDLDMTDLAAADGPQVETHWAPDSGRKL